MIGKEEVAGFIVFVVVLYFFINWIIDQLS